jgi:hypothetical protein
LYVLCLVLTQSNSNFPFTMQFFLELWAEINRRTNLRAKADTHPSLPEPKGMPDEYAPEGTIFEELVVQYRKLVDRAEGMIVQQVCGEIETGLKAHFISYALPLSSDSALFNSFFEQVRCRVGSVGR